MNFGKILRKYWYIVLLVLVAIGALAYLVSNSEDPKDLLRDYGYWVILIWTFLEGETIVIVAGWVSRDIGLDPKFIALCAFSGSFCSDQIMFSLGKYKGPDVLRYFPKIAKKMDKATRLFEKYDTVLILGFRFVYGVRNITPIMLGLSNVGHKKFFLLNFIGAGIWAVTFTYGGLYAGKAFMTLMHRVGHGIFYVLLAAAVGTGLFLFFRFRSSSRKAKEAEQEQKQ